MMLSNESIYIGDIQSRIVSHELKTNKIAAPSKIMLKENKIK